MVKTCPQGKILNPKTKRCVKKDGKIGKEILAKQKGNQPKNQPKSPTPNQNNQCPPDKILNPATGRCVKRTGKIGKEILANQTPKVTKKSEPVDKSIIIPPPKNPDKQLLSNNMAMCLFSSNNFRRYRFGEAIMKVMFKSMFPNNCYHDTKLHYNKNRPQGWKVYLHAEYKNDILEDLNIKKFKKQLDSCTKRLTFVNLSVHEQDIISKGSSHVTLLIFDHHKKIVEHFDSYGEPSDIESYQYEEDYPISASESLENISIVNKLCKKLGFKYLSPKYVTPEYGPKQKYWEVTGPQFSTDKIQNKRKEKEIGYCGIWVQWITYIKSLNPDVPTKQLLTEVLSKISPNELMDVMKKSAINMFKYLPITKKGKKYYYEGKELKNWN